MDANYWEGFINELTTAWNQQNRQKILAFYDNNYHGEESSDPHEQYGLASVQGMLEKFFSAFPDLVIQPIDWVGNGSKLSLYWEAKGTHKGSILNIPPTGKPIRVRGVSFLNIQDNKIKHAKHLWDMAGMLRHLGLLPALPA
ncbi:MAG TPA: ester cyclase [Saprospiraceae bacterium]|nr:ester cyclase [Saprospiraceae bacterium]HMQ82755.1 ester cyclase [Saprospiraceae bacterium]